MYETENWPEDSEKEENFQRILVAIKTKEETENRQIIDYLENCWTYDEATRTIAWAKRLLSKDRMFEEEIDY